MKTKLFVTVLTALFLWGCSSEEPQTMVSDVTTSAEMPRSRFISSEEACEIARHSMVDMEFASASRSNKDAVAYLYQSSGLSRGETNDSLFYVVNFDDGGFALILAKRDVPVSTIAISETGTFEENDNPASRDYVMALSNSVLCSDSSDSNSNDSLVIRDNSWFEWPKPDIPIGPATPIPWMVDEEGYPTTTFTTTDTYENFLKVAWRQRYPYNIYCDALSQKDIEKTIREGTEYIYNGRGLVGCVPVALAQICSHYEKPSIIDGRNIDWAVMTSGYSIYSLSNGYRDDLAYMLARIGKSIGIKHGIETSASINGAKSFLKTSGYSNVKITTKTSECFSNLINGQVIFVCGYSTKGAGHAWVADGYKRITKEKVRFDKETGTHYQVMKTDRYHYFSFNWGWGDPDHVYYLIGEPYKSGHKDSDNDEIVYNSSYSYIIDIE